MRLEHQGSTLRLLVTTVEKEKIEELVGIQ